MKKALLTSLIAASFALTGCNMDALPGSYSFHYAHVQLYSQSSPVVHFRVNSWKNDEGGIELEVEGYGAILLGDGTYVLYDTERCPICGQIYYK